MDASGHFTRKFQPAVVKVPPRHTPPRSPARPGAAPAPWPHPARPGDAPRGARGMREIRRKTLGKKGEKGLETGEFILEAWLKMVKTLEKMGVEGFLRGSLRGKNGKHISYDLIANIDTYIKNNK